MTSSTRSLLFVPGSRLDRLPRALASGADLICLDLEDSVPPADKAEARAAVRGALATSSAARVGVRINGRATPWHAEDLAALAGAGFALLPKTESAEDVVATRAALGPMDLWALVESGRGVLAAEHIVQTAALAGVLFGAFDYAADVGCDNAFEPLLFARSRLAAACAAATLPLMDAPSGDLGDLEGLEASTRRSKSLGFTARACIHPAQVEVVNRVHTPSRDEVAEARRVLSAYAAAAGAAAQLDGRLIELPLALAARRTLDRAGLGTDASSQGED